MSKYSKCPRCGHDPYGISSSWMWIYRCKDCATRFCHECSGSNGGRKCPKCESKSIEKDSECHTAR